MEPKITVLLLLGLALGILYRTLEPYRRKLRQEKIEVFDWTYAWTALIAFVGALMSALALLPEAAAAWAAGWPFGTGYAAALGFGFLWALGWNYGTNQAMKHLEG